MAVASLAAVLAMSTAIAACDKQGGPRSDPQPSAGRVVSSTPATPAARSTAAPDKDRPRVDPACFDVYARCPAITGLPAISADGRRVAVPDLGPEDARDEFILTMRILDVDTGEELARTALLTHQDRQRWADTGTGELAEAFRPELDQRVQTFQDTLTSGDFGPLTSLGTVHEQRPSDPVAGMRATFDGVELTIADLGQDIASGTASVASPGASPGTNASAIAWRRTISRTPPASVAGGQECGPIPVADIALWVSREHRVALARVAHMTPDHCSVAPYYLVSRL